MKIIENYKNISHCVRVESWRSGPRVCVFAWIHGNEKSWILALWQFYELLKSSEIEILKWSLTMVLQANFYAIAQDKREIKHNMNRLFRDDLKENLQDEEIQRAEELKVLLQDCDYFLDLHSTSWKSDPFCFAESQTFDFIKTLGIGRAICGWWALGGVLSWDTECYANSQWAISLTFEAWNHNNEEWEKNAFGVIKNFLCKCWLLQDSYFEKLTKEKKFARVWKTYVCKNTNFKYTKEYKNLQFVKKWEIIAHDGNKPVVAEQDFLIVMPKSEEIIKPDVEAFLYGEMMED